MQRAQAEWLSTKKVAAQALMTTHTHTHTHKRK